jgi:hypothetical protein
MEDYGDWMNQEYDLPSATFPPDALSLPQLPQGTADRNTHHSMPAQYAAQAQPEPPPLTTRSVPQPTAATHAPTVPSSDVAPLYTHTLAWGNGQHAVPFNQAAPQSHPNHHRKHPHTREQIRITKTAPGVTQENNRLARLHSE